jgi:3-methyladenine DNA glycosylase AlkD
MMTTPPLPLDDLQSDLELHAEEAKRDWWERYLKGQASFRGVPTPVVRELSVAWWERHDGDGLTAEEQLEACLALLRCPLTEDKLSGMLLLGERLIPRGLVDGRSAVPRFAELYPAGDLADWNAVDWFCVRVLGPLIDVTGDACARAIAGWVEAAVLWQRRSALVAFVTLAPSGRYAELIVDTADRLVLDQERFAQSGVAWVMRELSRERADLTKPFLRRHAGQMSIRTRRQAGSGRRR